MTRPILLPLPNAPSDAELVARAIEGDRFGRELIYRRHAAYLLEMVTRLVASRDGAEAIVRETFVVAWKRLATLTTTAENAELRAWLSRIAVGLARRRLRRARMLRFFGLGLEPGDDDDQDARLAALAAVDLRHDARQDLEHIDRVLDRARVEPRIAWMLRRVDGLTLDDVAAVCACPPATAERRIAEIDARLGERFGTPAVSP